MDRLHVGTLNIRNLADRWDERLPLILADMAALQPDVLGLQEVVYVLQQDRLIGAAGEGRYDAHRGWAGASPAARRNVTRLEEAMAAEGFEPLPTEWWHFDGPGWERYELLDRPLTE